jgi:hypothetical protein
VTLEAASAVENHDVLLGGDTDLLHVIPEESNAGLREFAIAQIVEPCLDHADGHERFFLELLADIVDDRDDDSRVQLRGIQLVARGLSELDTTGEWRSLLVDIVTDESKAPDVRESALDSLVETTDVSAVDGTLLTTLDTVAESDSESLRTAALANVGTVLTEDGNSLDAEQLEQLHRLLGRGLVDEVEEVRHATARTVAAVHRAGGPLSLDGRAGDLRRLLGTMEFDPADKVELVDIVSHENEPVQVRPSGRQADDQIRG